MARRARAAGLAGALALALLVVAPSAAAAPCPDPEAVTLTAPDGPTAGGTFPVRVDVAVGVIGPVTGSVTVAGDDDGAQPFGPIYARQTATLVFTAPAVIGTQFGIRAAWSIAGSAYGALSCDGASSVAATASAPPPPPGRQPRVDGLWRATTTPIGRRGPPERAKGRVVPRCRQGACDFRFLGRRWRRDGERYRVTFATVVSCRTASGRIVARRAYTARTAVVVRVAERSVIGGATRATRLRGQTTTLYVANARGRAAGCRPRYALTDRLVLRRLGS